MQIADVESWLQTRSGAPLVAPAAATDIADAVAAALLSQQTWQVLPACRVARSLLHDDDAQHEPHIEALRQALLQNRRLLRELPLAATSTASGPVPAHCLSYLTAEIGYRLPDAAARAAWFQSIFATIACEEPHTHEQQQQQQHSPLHLLGACRAVLKRCRAASHPERQPQAGADEGRSQQQLQQQRHHAAADACAAAALAHAARLLRAAAAAAAAPLLHAVLSLALDLWKHARGGGDAAAAADCRRVLRAAAAAAPPPHALLAHDAPCHLRWLELVAALQSPPLLSAALSSLLPVAASLLPPLDELEAAAADVSGDGGACALIDGAVAARALRRRGLLLALQSSMAAPADGSAGDGGSDNSDASSTSGLDGDSSSSDGSDAASNDDRGGASGGGSAANAVGSTSDVGSSRRSPPRDADASVSAVAAQVLSAALSGAADAPRSFVLLFADNDAQLFEALHAAAALAAALPAAAPLSSALPPGALLSQLLDLIAHDSTVLLDWLMSPETCALLYLTRVAAALAAAAAPLSTRDAVALRELAAKLRRLHRKGLFPYDPSPLAARLERLTGE
ncbi:hypothetical protein JKP88DRAFT_306534 [Tribonema minus]|uniref:Uncharacterized protein n=1 Tax=Tribonema minus TaxID=303371 RepID=A0A835Z8V2_9STRA|nr:hypothetical protein JKP88DRAFT_306534 [Tribonema minus]